MNAHEQVQQTVTAAGNATAVGVTGATVAGMLPSIAAVFSCIWLGIQIWESKTVRKIVARLLRRKAHNDETNENFPTGPGPN